MTAPCYLCGTPSVVDGLCGDCYAKEHPLVTTPSVINLLSCKRCGAVKVPGGWKVILNTEPNTEEMLEQQLDIALDREIRINVPESEMLVEIEKRLDRVLKINLMITGRSHPSFDTHSETYPIEIRLEYGTCDTCGMMSGGYHEAILQVRADERFLTDEEIRDVQELVASRTINEYGKDTKAFVTHVSETKFGLDFMIGSEHLCKQIADELQSKYLAERKDNFKLIGQDRGGKEKFRTTILIRLLRYTTGDIIRVLNEPCQVLDITKGGVSCINLIDRNTFTMNPKSAKWRTIEYLVGAEDINEYMVIARTPDNSVQVMDSESYQIYEIGDNLVDPDIENGEKIRAVIIEDRLYPVQL
jgi:nonsense-mediated mRNA decay protein 3